MNQPQPDRKRAAPPPAEGKRLGWEAAPEAVRAAVEQWLGSPIVAVTSQATGFSPGVAARLQSADGRRVFVKAAGSQPNPVTPLMHKREARIAALLPADAPVPRLLWSSVDAESEWVTLVFEEIDGHHPAQPWRLSELERVVDAMGALANLLTPSPLSADVVGTASAEFASYLCGWQALLNDEPSVRARLDGWSTRHLDALARLEAEAATAVEGNTLLHFDVRADNLLLTPERVWFLDWPLARVGAAWVDVVFFAPSVTMQGGPPPEQVVARHPAYKAADREAVTAAIAAVAGFFTRNALLPPPPGLPTLRAFQAAQGDVAREWLAERTGWR